MIQSLTNSGPSLTLEMLSRDRNGMELTLPPAYANWLLKHNGGEPSPNTVQVKVWGENRVIEVHHFLSFEPAGDAGLGDTLQRWRHHMIGEMEVPPNLLVIAKDSDGGHAFFLLDTSDERGPISLWYIYSGGYEEDSHANKIHPIFDSFSDFIDAIGGA